MVIYVYDEKYRLASNINLVIFCISERNDTLRTLASPVSFPESQGTLTVREGISSALYW